MSDFDPAQIVPSMRDFAAAVTTRKKGLALVPWLDGVDVGDHVRRLDALDVRAFAIDADEGANIEAAKASASTPILNLRPARSAVLCQRQRFFGADAVTLVAADFATLAKTVQSMRMMPVARVESDLAADDRARVYLIAGELAEVLRLAGRVASNIVTLALVPDLDVSNLLALNGVVDAAIIPAAIHDGEGFEGLLDELDS